MSGPCRFECKSLKITGELLFKAINWESHYLEKHAVMWGSRLLEEQ